MRTRPLVLLLGLTLLAGCTSTSEGTPRPTATSDTAGNEGPDDAELPFAGAPAVNDPLNTEQFQQNPCQSLTTAQAQELVVVTGEPYDGTLGNACKWKSSDDRLAYVDVRFLTDDPRGLSALYQANEDGAYVYFDQLDPIEGYPAVTRGGTDGREGGRCTVVVGTSNEDAFEVVLRLSQANVGELDPCETAAMVAGMALQTMQAAS
jgi:hypothetical protein